MRCQAVLTVPWRLAELLFAHWTSEVVWALDGAGTSTLGSSCVGRESIKQAIATSPGIAWWRRRSLAAKAHAVLVDHLAISAVAQRWKLVGGGLCLQRLRASCLSCKLVCRLVGRHPNPPPKVSVLLLLLG